MKKLSKPALIGVIVAAIVVIVAATATTTVVVKKNKASKSGAYRNVSVYDIVGKVDLKRDGEKMEPYVDMKLANGDYVTTHEESYLQMLLDEDKYVHVEPESEVSFEATGTSADSKTTFELKKGTVVNSIHNKLSEDSEYTVNTPNSTMAVRGTTYRVYCFYDDAGIFHTVIEVFSGKVEVHLVLPNGKIDPEPVVVEAGTAASIWMDGKETGWDYKDGEIDMKSLPLETVKFLKLMIKDGEKLCVSEDDIDDLIELMSEEYTVTFVNDGRTFGTQQVLYREKAVEPMLKPTADGQWDFDFETLIEEDTTIKWQDQTVEEIYED